MRLRSLFHVLPLSVLALACSGAPADPSSEGAGAAAATNGPTGPVTPSHDLAVPIIPIIPLDPNLLYNPGFETPDTTYVPLYAGLVDRGNPPNAWFAGWGTTALDWPATSNELSYSTVTTWLTNVTWPGDSASTHSILVACGTEDGGIAQQYLGNWTANTTAPLHQQVTVHAKVIAGKLTVGIGNSTQTNLAATAPRWAYGTSLVDPNAAAGPQWETVSVCAPPGVQANEVIFYALEGGGPATYYLDDASVYWVSSSTCP
jgi:hypothetical protein